MVQVRKCGMIYYSQEKGKEITQKKAPNKKVTKKEIKRGKNYDKRNES